MKNPNCRVGFHVNRMHTFGSVTRSVKLQIPKDNPLGIGPGTLLYPRFDALAHQIVFHLKERGRFAISVHADQANQKHWKTHWNPPVEFNERRVSEVKTRWGKTMFAIECPVHLG